MQMQFIGFLVESNEFHLELISGNKAYLRQVDNIPGIIFAKLKQFICRHISKYKSIGKK